MSCLRGWTLGGRFAFAVFLVGMSAAPAARGAIIYWTGPGGNGHGYEVVSTGPAGIGWTGAQSAAHARGGALAGGSSAAENAFIFSLIDDPPYWFGPSGR